MANKRKQNRDRFLKKCSLQTAQMTALAQDASFRCYFRLFHNNQSYILMDAPPEHEKILPFIQVAKHLTHLGLNAPTIFHHDIENGFILLEDFGDDTFTRLLAKKADETRLYCMAIDTLAKIHNHPDSIQIEIPHYDEALLIDEALLFCDWYIEAKTAKPIKPKIRDEFIECWKTIFQALPSPSQTLVLRDFHVDNIISLKNASCGLLDFQDAVLGHHSYDLVSLLEDARRDISDDLRSILLKHYFKLCPEQNNSDFIRWYQVLGTQRHLKVLGIFSRLALRDGKSQYLPHIPRVEKLTRFHLDKKDLLPLNTWLIKNKLN